VILIYSFDLLNIKIRHTLYNGVVVLNIKLQSDSSPVLYDFLVQDVFFFIIVKYACVAHIMPIYL